MSGFFVWLFLGFAWVMVSLTTKAHFRLQTSWEYIPRWPLNGSLHFHERLSLEDDSFSSQNFVFSEFSLSCFLFQDFPFSSQENKTKILSRHYDLEWPYQKKKKILASIKIVVGPQVQNFKILALIIGKFSSIHSLSFLLFFFCSLFFFGFWVLNESNMV